MYSKLVVLVLSVAAVSAAVSSDFKPSPRINMRDLAAHREFDELIHYMETNMSPSEREQYLETLPEDLLDGLEEPQEQELEIEARSVGSAIGNVFEHIPWGKITDGLKKMSRNDSKFTKVLNLVNDQKFRDLVKKSVNSHTLAEFVKGVAEHGFSWTEFLHLMLHAMCSAATTIQHDQYSVGVCKVLQSL